MRLLGRGGSFAGEIGDQKILKVLLGEVVEGQEVVLFGIQLRCSGRVLRLSPTVECNSRPAIRCSYSSLDSILGGISIASSSDTEPSHVSY